MATEANIDLLFSFLRYDSCLSVKQKYKKYLIHQKKSQYLIMYYKLHGI